MRWWYQTFPMRSSEFAQAEIWKKSAFTSGPLTWWQTFVYDNDLLRECALRVCSVVTIVSFAEQNLSLFGFIHSKNRNRLYQGKAEKLVYIYNNMRMLRKVRNADSQGPCVLPYCSDSDEDGSED